jgi:hypothetical protein
MEEFTYTVFMVVASMIGALLTLFVGIIATALLYDGEGPVHAITEPLPESPAQYRQAA